MFLIVWNRNLEFVFELKGNIQIISYIVDFLRLKVTVT